MEIQVEQTSNAQGSYFWQWQSTRIALFMVRTATVCLSAYWLTIFVATHTPQANLPSLAWSDKTYHIIAYIGLSFLLAWALRLRGRHYLRHIACVAIVGVGYACLDELTQYFIPGRSCEAMDVVADTIGIALGLGIYHACRFTLLQFIWGKRLIMALSR